MICIAVIILPALVHAQQEDSARLLSEEMNKIMLDTTEQVAAPVEADEDDYQDEPAVATPVFFLRKDLQASGGGPDTVYQRQLPDSFVAALQKDGDFWYVNYPFEKREEAEIEGNIPLSETSFFQTILWVLIIGGFVAFVKPSAFQARVDSAPRREQEILVLTRDYQKLSENYARLLTKKLDAEMAANLEQQHAGRQFRILDPANLPQQPSFPNRNRFALAGAIAGLLLGAGLAVLVDWLDPTLKDADEAAAVLGLPLLAVIPFVPPKQQRRLAAMRPAEAARAHNGTDFSRRRHAALTRTAAQHRGPESL
jgi:hypothetical protein